jgi:3-oxoacyl-[acyl-carrier protein] reductase
MPQSLQGKRAFVTGGSRGIGGAIVRRLAADGAAVAFTYVSQPEVARQLAESVAATGARCLPYQADSSDPAALTQAVDRAAAELGGLDILVNNAGVALVAPIEQFTLADFDRTVAVNVRAVFVAIQAALRHMPPGSRIINIGSCNAERMPFPGGGVYAMSKSAMIGLVKGLSRDLGPRAITINNVEPGPTDTDMNPATGPAADFLRSIMSLGRYGRQEVAAFVAYVAGPEAGWITGASLDIDGGFNA